MKYLSFLCGSIWLLTACSTPENVVVTQTGNPTKISLRIEADTTAAAGTPALGKRASTSLVIDRAYLVIYKVEMEPTDGTEWVLFRGPNPYVVELLPHGGRGVVDSIDVVGSNAYQSIEMEFGPLSDSLSSPSIPNALMGRSVLVEGYFGSDSPTPFSFTSNMSESLEYSLDSTLVLPSARGAEILVRARVYDWFKDSLGVFIDPLDPGNRAIIERNITGSMDVEREANSTERE